MIVEAPVCDLVCGFASLEPVRLGRNAARDAAETARAAKMPASAKAAVADGGFGVGPIWAYCVEKPLNRPLAEKWLRRCDSLVWRYTSAWRGEEAHRQGRTTEGRAPSQKFSKHVSGLDNCDRSENWTFSTQ